MFAICLSKLICHHLQTQSGSNTFGLKGNWAKFGDTGDWRVSEAEAPLHKRVSMNYKPHDTKYIVNILVCLPCFISLSEVRFMLYATIHKINSITYMFIVIISIHNAGVISTGHKAMEIWRVRLLKTLTNDMNLSLNLLQAKSPQQLSVPRAQGQANNTMFF